MSNTLPVGTIIFDHVSKRYRLGMFGTLRGALGALRPGSRNDGDAARTLWALRDVSFEVKPGMALGLIGPNGAGKTTTLKLLSNITRPASGRILVNGRMSSLIELGAGFHPELTGRENIYLNGAILGMKRQEITRKLADIIAFAELERFIDTPVKRYSSGMYVRLGFAVAAHVEPDILLVDEVLAVGDARFRSRCMQRIRELQRGGTTVILVSHNMHQIREVCESAILLTNGQIAEQGTPANVIAGYEKLMFSATPDRSSSHSAANPTSSTTGHLLLTKVEVLHALPSGSELSTHAPATMKISYQATAPINIGRIHIGIYQDDSTLCCVADSAAANSDFESSELNGEGVIEVTFEPLRLVMGQYYAIVRVTDVSDAEVIASRQSPLFRVITETPGDHGGVFVPDVIWKMGSQSLQTPINTSAIDQEG